MQEIQKKLCDLKTGDSAQISSFTNDAMKQKLLELGCLPGESIEIVRFAPMGCPMAVRVAGTTWSIRVDEAENIIVNQNN